MEIFARDIKVSTASKTDFVDVTTMVNRVIRESKLKSGLASVFTKHTTTGIRVNENEELLIEDCKNLLDWCVPDSKYYNHDKIEKREVPENEPKNAHSHLKSLLLGASETIPFDNSRLSLGRWQSVFFVELDGPKDRTISVRAVGER